MSTAPQIAVREREALMRDLHEAYMEVFPAPGIEKKLEILEPNSYVAVTCSPTKGVDETIALTRRLRNQGFRVVPHVAAKCVRDHAHLERIMAELAELRVKSLFVPGGDASEPAGEFETALQLLEAIAFYDHDLREIGVAAHPEGHPEVDDDTLFRVLEAKQDYAQYMVTQMCFDADLLGRWLWDLRERGITMPVWIGLPGVIERTTLMKTSMRIGVGDSLKFLKRNPKAAAQLLKQSVYKPDDLVRGLAKYQADPEYRIAGYHLFCFNQVERTEAWRHEAIAALS